MQSPSSLPCYIINYDKTHAIRGVIISDITFPIDPAERVFRSRDGNEKISFEFLAEETGINKTMSIVGKRLMELLLAEDDIQSL